MKKCVSDILSFMQLGEANGDSPITYDMDMLPKTTSGCNLLHKH